MLYHFKFNLLSLFIVTSSLRMRSLTDSRVLNSVSIMVTTRVHQLISLSEDDVPGAKFSHPSVTNNSLSNRGGWNVEASHFLGRTPMYMEQGMA